MQNPTTNALNVHVDMEMIRPPVNRLMKVLDRSFFQQTQRICAVQIFNSKDIETVRGELKSDMFCQARVKPLVTLPAPGRPIKAFILRPGVQKEDQRTWSEKLRELNDAQRVKVIDYDLSLSYKDWGYHEIMNAILPEDLCGDELPSGFSIIGHVAHLNLREEYLPYKKLIAEVILDKNPTIRSVINKIDDVGAHSQFRTFKFELLAGDPDMNVEVRAENCLFSFDFSKVYWNPRLNTEHRRMINLFQPGEAVCDVMAGVGPFAVPSGKRNVFVWANDLNPDSFAGLEQAIKRNKVDNFVTPFQKDGKVFIREATRALAKANYKVHVPITISHQGLKPDSSKGDGPFETYFQPRIFSHYIMNLPGSASSFLPSFIGLFVGLEHLFMNPHSPNIPLELELPMIHLYCFSTKSNSNATEKICDEISRQLQTSEILGEKDVKVWPVRIVAPNKEMFCASFRLPAEVAFRRSEKQIEEESDRRNETLIWA